MKSFEAVSLMLGAFELRYWAVFSIVVSVAWMFGFVSMSAVVVAFCSCVIGGCMAGLRISRENGLC